MNNFSRKSTKEKFLTIRYLHSALHNEISTAKKFYKILRTLATVYCASHCREDKRDCLTKLNPL